MRPYVSAAETCTDCEGSSLGQYEFSLNLTTFIGISFKYCMLYIDIHSVCCIVCLCVTWSDSQNLKQQKFLWFPGYTGSSDPTVTSSDVNYAVILIVRPLALVATFLAAYGVRHFYPNVFCYE